MAKTRLHYFDMIKGLAIFMVVMGHVLTICIRDIDQTFLFKLIEKVHMPLFFFISGYFSYKMAENGKDFVCPNLWKRFKQLIVPFVVVSSIWIYYYPHSGLQSPFDSTWHGLYFNKDKNGYWFTLCLFEIILVYSALAPLLARVKTTINAIGVCVIVWLLLGFLSFYLPDNIIALLGLKTVSRFFPIFIVGVFAKRHTEFFNTVITNNAAYTLSFILFGILVYYVCYPWEFPPLDNEIATTIGSILLQVSLVVIAVAIVKPWGENAFAATQGHRLAQMWEKVGKESLAIYLLHYFFLFPMTFMQQPLKAMALDFAPSFVVATITAAVIVALVLALNHFISKSKLLALLLTGKV